MTWAEALGRFTRKHLKNLSSKEVEILYEYPWHAYSIASLWSHRGVIWKKHEGRYPTPSEVGLEPDHAFFDPDVVCVSRTYDRNQKLLSVEQYFRGRRLKPTHKLWQRVPS